MKETTAGKVLAGALSAWMALLLALMALPSSARAESGEPGVLRAQTATIAAAVTTPYQIYLPVLGRAVMGQDEFAGDYQAAPPDAWAPTFSVFDLSADGVPEMLVRTPTFAGRSNVHVFTVGSSAAAYLGSYAEGAGGSFGSAATGIVYTLEDGDAAYVNTVTADKKAIAFRYATAGTHAQAASFLSARGATALKFSSVADMPDLAGSAKYNLRNATASVSGAFTYNGSAQTPKVTVRFSNKTLGEGVDYKVSYSNNKNAGTATATVTGLGAYTGTASATFTINPIEISRPTAKAITARTYTGAALTPVPALTFNGASLRNGTDFKLAYSSNKAAGTGRIKVTGKGNYKGTRTLTFFISRAKISSATASKIANQTYNGKAKKPKPTVTYKGKTLKNGTDYMLSYSNNINKGTAKVVVTGKGNFQGTKTVSFKIK